MERIKLNIQKFATSGSISTPANEDGTYFYLTWNRTSTSIANNTSTIWWELRIVAAYTYYDNAVSTGQTVINGQVVHGGETYSNIQRGDHGITGGYLTIPHNDDGTKSFAASISGWTWGCSWVSANNNSSPFVLNSIPRASKINTVSITDLQSRTNNIEGTFKVNYTRYYSSFKDNLIITVNGNTLKTIENYISDTEFTLTSAELNTLYNEMRLTNSIPITFKMQTYNGSTLIGTGTSVVETCYVYDCEPVFNDFDIQDINSATTILTEGISPGTVNHVINVNGYSNIKVSIPVAKKAIAQKGADIVSYRFVIGNQTKDIVYSSSSEVYDTIENATEGVYNVYAIDSRGNSKLITKLAESIKDYVPLTRNTNFKVERNNNNVGDRATLTFSGTIWNSSFGTVSNAFISAKYYLKKTDSSTWIDLGASMTDITPTITDNSYSFSGLIRSNNADTTWDLDSSYDIKVILEDELSSVEFETVLASAIPNISLSKNGVGIMCNYDETLGGLVQVGGKVLDWSKVAVAEVYNATRRVYNSTGDVNNIINVSSVNGTVLCYFITRAWPQENWNNGAMVEIGDMFPQTNKVYLKSTSTQNYWLQISALYISN